MNTEGAETDVVSDAEPKSKATLRELPTSGRHFWRPSIAEQLSLKAYDKGNDMNIRELPQSEIMAMALNEISAEHGHGFFYHVKNRDGWNVKPGEELCPESRFRSRSMLDAHFPSLVYAALPWDLESQARFQEASHRSRYLTADGLIHPPTGDAPPLYGIQYAKHPKYALWATETPSLVILTAASSIYVAPAAKLVPIFGLWPRSKPKPQGPRLDIRLNTAPALWEPYIDPKLVEDMAQFMVPTVEALHDAIAEYCRGAEPSFTANEFRRLIPRPPLPERGLALGEQLTGTGSATALSRRGGRKDRGRKA